MDDKIYFYDAANKYGEFSNFYKQSTPLKIDGKEYETVEHYFQSEKFPDFPEYQEIVKNAKTAAQTKYYGSMKCSQNYNWAIPIKDTIQKYKESGVKLRDDWEQVKDQIMLKGLRAKFEQCKHCRKILLDTSDKILSENTKADRYWGNGGDLNKVGKLGELLMLVREEIKMDIFIRGVLSFLGEEKFKELMLNCFDKLNIKINN
jgi:ribA/ribD-fused uncharacterized protein